MKHQGWLPTRFLAPPGNEAQVAKERHAAFKIIPRIQEGSWVIKQAVGQNTPVLLGRKLTTKYFRRATPVQGHRVLSYMLVSGDTGLRAQEESASCLLVHAPRCMMVSCLK